MIYDFIGFIRGDSHLYRPDRTNESLRAIVAGLEVSEQDNILSIGGSGEQAFAMIERGAKVTAIDYKRFSCRRIRRRAKLFESGRFEELVDEPNSLLQWYLRTPPLQSYFSNHSVRMEEYKKKLEI